MTYRNIFCSEHYLSPICFNENLTLGKKGKDMPVSSVTEHWIKQDAITINLNHFGDPDYLQVSVLAGAVVMAFKQDVISYNAAHNYRTWPLQAANTYLESTSAVNVYARLN